MKSTRIRLEGLTKRFGSVTVVAGLTLDIAPGTLVALLGPSGCGKTTVLRMLAGLVQPTSGEIYADERSILKVPVHRRGIGMLFQGYALFPHLTVAENVAFGLQMRGARKEDVARRVHGALEMVQLADFGGRLPRELSGGQQQRVALARAIVIEPSMLLLDEPLGALDKGLRESMQIEVRALQRRLGLTTIMVTHDQDEALTMADRILLMRNGRLEQEGTPEEIYRQPRSPFVANFIGASNLFHGKVVSSNAEGSEVVTPGGQRLRLETPFAVGADVAVSVRPEAISLSRTPDAAASDMGCNCLHARVGQIIYRGFMTQYHLEVESAKPLLAFMQNTTEGRTDGFNVGDRVVAHWGASSNHALKAD